MNIETYITNNRNDVKGILHYKVIRAPYGTVLAGMLNDRLCWIGFDLDPQSIQNRFPAVTLHQTEEVIDFSTVALYGTSFQLSVWQSLLAIKKGAVVFYQDIANDIKRPQSVRAVASAVGANPVSVLIPCHRVVPKSGGVGDYLWGPDTKAALLKAENVTL